MDVAEAVETETVHLSKKDLRPTSHPSKSRRMQRDQSRSQWKRQGFRLAYMLWAQDKDLVPPKEEQVFN